MKIVALNGSQRKNRGFTYFMLEKIGEGVVKSGGEYEIIELSQKNIIECIACEKCQKEIGAECIFTKKDDVKQIYDKIKESDLVIYATPVYIFQISSLLKRLFERFYGIGNSREFNITKSGLTFHYVDREVCAKKFAVVISCDNVEKKTTQNIAEYFKIFSMFFDTECIGVIKRNFAWYFLKKRESKEFYEMVEGLQKAGEELTLKGKISRKTIRKIEKRIVPIPEFILKILKKTEYGKEKILENIKKFKLNM